MIMPGAVRRRALTEDEALAQLGPRRPAAVERAWAAYDALEQAAWDRYSVQRDFLAGRSYINCVTAAREACARAVRKARYG